MVGKSHGLRLLQVGVAGHHRFFVLFGHGEKGLFHFFEHFNDAVGFLQKVQTGVQRHLIVAASGSVELFAGIADFGDEHGFHIHMDVFGGDVEFGFAGFDLR